MDDQTEVTTKRCNLDDERLRVLLEETARSIDPDLLLVEPGQWLTFRVLTNATDPDGVDVWLINRRRVGVCAVVGDPITRWVAHQVAERLAVTLDGWVNCGGERWRGQPDAYQTIWAYATISIWNRDSSMLEPLSRIVDDAMASQPGWNRHLGLDSCYIPPRSG